MAFAIGATVAIVIVVLTACGEKQGPPVGRVIDRTYDDPDTWYVSGYTISGSCMSYDKNGSCTYRSADVYIPGHEEHDGPHWKVKLRRGEGKTAVEGWRRVSEDRYDACQMGTWCDTTDRTDGT
jgi:hypothetical protein